VFVITLLPTLNACLNATSAILLLIGYRSMQQKHIKAHRACMLGACGVSLLFFASYLTYHYYVGVTRFPGEGWVRPVYFGILISHTVLAALLPFFVLVTLTRAFRAQFLRHRQIARWTFPLWLYVSVTGIVVYLMLYHLYPVT
jgi:putative membrane protein